MNATGTDEITAYVEAVRAALAGLPETTRNELLEDLPEHLAEVAADGIGTLTDRLGPPSVYAAELLASAGFVGGFPDPPPSVDRYAELREVTLHRLRVVDAKVGPLFGYARASEFLTMLRPAWWVLRGYLAAMVIAWLLDDSGQPLGLLPRIGGSEVVAVLLLARLEPAPVAERRDVHVGQAQLDEPQRLLHVRLPRLRCHSRVNSPTKGTAGSTW